MTFAQQAEEMIKKATSRRREPISASTASTYQSLLRNWINPSLGQLPLEQVNNGSLRDLIARMAQAHLSAATIGLADTVVKAVVASAVDQNGEPLYPRKWNNEFTDLPVIDPKLQKAPAIASETITVAISRAFNPDKALYALLAGTGLRIGEAAILGIRKGVNVWDPEAATITVGGTLSRGRVKESPKTEAGYRVIDLHPRLNTWLKIQLGTEPGEPFRADEKTLRAHLIKAGIDGGFHAFRRFRVTRLREAGVPEGLIQYWDGHAGETMTDRYDKSREEIQLRKEWAARVELGFQLETA